MMKRLVALTILFVMISAGITTRAEDENNYYKEYFVSPAGSDSAVGSKKFPFRTIERAQKEVREAVKNMAGDICVNILTGTYFLDKTLTLTDADSGQNGYKVIYRGIDNPIVSGGIKLNDWQQHDGNIYKTQVPKSFGDRYIAGFYIDDSSKKRAQTEKDVEALGYYDAPSALAGVHSGYLFKKEDLPVYENSHDIEVSRLWAWRQIFLPATGIINVDDETNALLFKQDEFRQSNIITETKSFMLKIYNAYELMDTPGEFYYDRTKQTLYYYKEDDEDLNESQTIIPNLEKVLEIKGENAFNKAHDITVTGITFAHTVSDERAREYMFNSTQGNQIRDFCYDEKYFYPQIALGIRGGIWLHYAKNISFTQNTVKQMQGVGIGIYDGLEESAIEGNVIYDTASSAITAGLFGHEYSWLEKDGYSNISFRKPVTGSNMNPGKNFISSPTVITAGEYTNSKYSNSVDAVNWVQIDLQNAYSIGKVVIPCDHDNFGSATRMDFDILGSNDPNFAEYQILARQKKDLSKFPWMGSYEVTIKDPTKYRYVRIVKQGNTLFQQINVFTRDLDGMPLAQYSENCKISNNYITRASTTYIATSGIEAYYVKGFDISHNEIYDSPYSAINLGWGWARGRAEFVSDNKINFNRIENSMMYLNDGGAIYLLGPQPNSELVGNYVKGSWYYPGGIYPDNGSAGWTIKNNVVEDVVYSFFPWSSDEKDIKIEENYVSVPNYRLGASNSYIKDTEIYIKNHPPSHVEKIKNNAGLTDKFKHISAISGRTEQKRWAGDYPVADDYALMYYNSNRSNSALDYLSPGLLSEANGIIKIIMDSDLHNGIYEKQFNEFKNKVEDFKAYLSDEMRTADGVAKLMYDFKYDIEAFTNCGIFDNGYKSVLFSDGIIKDDSQVPIIKEGTVKGDMFIDNAKAFNIPITITSRLSDDKRELFVEKANVRNLYYHDAKFEDVMFEFDFKYNYVPYDFPGFTIRSKDRNSYMETAQNAAYSFNFGDKELTLQRFNGGKRTVIFGMAEGVAPTSGVKKLDLPMLSYTENNKIRVGVFNEKNGVRLILEINGERVVDFVDSAEGYIKEPGYFGILAPFCGVTLAKP